MQREDTQPWYRQFWPWFIIALPASAVVAGLFTLWLAMQTTDTLIEEADVGMDVVTERNLAAERTAAELGITATVQIEAGSGAIVATVSSDAELDDVATLGLRLRHPTMAARDAAAELTRALPDADGNPTWAGHLLQVPEGRYFMTLSSPSGWRLTDEWNGQTLLRLVPTHAPHNGER